MHRIDYAAAIALAVATPSTAQTGPAAPAAECAGCVTVPALTPVRIELLAGVGSRTSRTGDTFPIRLAAPIVVEGRELVPAGATGIGEVVFAKKGGGAAAGELVIAARYVEVGGARLPLRSLSLPPGNSYVVRRPGTANLISAWYLENGQTTIPAGEILSAKTAAPFSARP